MSEALTKAAEFSPEQLLLMSALTGGAGFGGMRLLSELHQQMNPLTPPNNSIKLQLPNPHKKHEQVPGMDTAAIDPGMGSQQPQLSKAAQGEYDPSWWHPLAAVGLGLPAGFLGTKALYDTYQNHEYNKKIEVAKKQYMDQLNLTQSMGANGPAKIASVTPKVDALCEAMAQELDKTAGLKDIILGLARSGVNKVHGGIDVLGKGAKAVKNFPQDIGTSWKGLGGGAAGVGGLAGLGAAAKYQHDIGTGPVQTQGPGAGQPISPIADPAALQHAQGVVEDNSTSAIKGTVDSWLGHTPSAARDAWKGVAGLSTIGMLGMLMHNHSKKKEREQKANYPTTVEYAG